MNIWTIAQKNIAPGRGNTDLRRKALRNGPGFYGIAASCGIPGRDVFTASGLEEAIREMLATPGKSCRETILA